MLDGDLVSQRTFLIWSNNIETFSKEMLGNTWQCCQYFKTGCRLDSTSKRKGNLDCCRKSPEANKRETNHSWTKDRGNMSSSTILHVLQNMIKILSYETEGIEMLYDVRTGTYDGKLYS